MHAIVMVLAAASLAGCAVQRAPERISSGEAGQRALVRNIPEIAAGVLHCDGPGAHNGFTKCDGIPVMVLYPDDPPAGRCVSLLPYNQLVVHTGRNKPATAVVWQLTAPTDYRFDDDKGITFLQSSTSFPAGKALGDGKQFKVNIPANAASASVGHQALVKLPPNVGGYCAQVDPRIINQE